MFRVLQNWLLRAVPKSMIRWLFAVWIQCCHWNMVAVHSLAASSLWNASVMGNSLLKCADQIAGVSLVMLRWNTLLVFIHKLRFCTCREVCHKSYAVDYVKLEEIPATRALESFSNSLPVNTQICCFEKAFPERRTYWSKKGWEKFVTKIKTTTMKTKVLIQLTSPCSGEWITMITIILRYLQCLVVEVVIGPTEMDVAPRALRWKKSSVLMSWF